MHSVTLKHPLPYGEGKITQIQFRRPMAGDLRGLKLAGLEQVDVNVVLTIAARTNTAGLPEAKLHELDPIDLIQVAGVVAGFFGESTESQTTPVAPGP